MSLETHIQEDAIRRIKHMECQIEILTAICEKILREVRPEYLAPAAFTVEEAPSLFDNDPLG